jgi:hypothetical protein
MLKGTLEGPLEGTLEGIEQLGKVSTEHVSPDAGV